MVVSGGFSLATIGLALLAGGIAGAVVLAVTRGRADTARPSRLALAVVVAIVVAVLAIVVLSFLQGGFGSTNY